MFFNKWIFIFASCFFISSCGLKIGEKAPGAPDYYFSHSDACSKADDYKKIFLDYFFEEGVFGEKISQVFYCISLKVKRFKGLIKHDHLNKQQTVNILNQDFIQKSYIKKVVDNIFKPEYFDDYMSIKNNLIYLAQPEFKKAYLQKDRVCPTHQDDDNIVSKKSVDALVSALESFSELFSSAEKSAYIVFSEFFAKRSINKLELRESESALFEFSSFLSDYFSEIFPSYSHFLKKHIEKSRLQIADAQAKRFEDRLFFREGMEEKTKIALQLAMEPLLSLFDLPFLSGNEIKPQNLKYMMLNIYLMRAFFKAYDLNKDFILSSEELRPLSCLMTPLVSILASSELKEKWKIIQDIYDSKAVSNYIINYKRLPPVEQSFKAFFDRNTWRFLFFRLTESDELYDQSYTEASQLISMLFLEFLNKIQFEKP